MNSGAKRCIQVSLRFLVSKYSPVTSQCHNSVSCLTVLTSRWQYWPGCSGDAADSGLYCCTGETRRRKAATGNMPHEHGQIMRQWAPLGTDMFKTPTSPSQEQDPQTERDTKQLQTHNRCVVVLHLFPAVLGVSGVV